MLTVRRATRDDCRLLWEWVNDPVTREQSFSQAPVPWDDHVKWFEARLDSSDSVIYIIGDEEARPIGQVRFESRAEAGKELDISLASAQRGRGLGAEALRAACRAMRRESTATIVAHVKPDNVPSLRTFERAGFVRAGVERLHGVDAVRFECHDGCPEPRS